ncbi:MAG: S-methyl-5-thioribose kinase [Peptoniphilaceae bacterium]|nr:S-methyl-5-thioribose kinase [Peptoniphilaceae bacterium]MDY6019308.1 S-methyl-5-thioribose kinase [Anaerococcus sp.]
MISKIMKKDQVIDFVYSNLDFFNDKNFISCEEIGDGNINYVFRLKEGEKSLIVKQADVLLRSSARPLDINRSAIEAKALSLEYKLSSGCVPKVYLYDKEKSLIVMEDIGEYKNLRKELLEDRFYSNLAENLSDFISKTLIPTTDLVIDRKVKKEKVREFINPDLCDISEDLVFTEPYYDYKGRNLISEGLLAFVEKNLYNNKKLHTEVLKLKDKFQTKAQALLHGDLHLGSIFVNEKGIKVIDPEFAFYGPIGYDIGNIWGNLFFPLTNAIIREKYKKIIEELTKIIIETINLTNKKLSRIYDDTVTNKFYKNDAYKSFYINEIIADSYGYAGTEIIRRTVGDSKVIEITSISEIDKRKKLDKILIDFGIYLIKNRANINKTSLLMEKYKDSVKKYL